MHAYVDYLFCTECLVCGDQLGGLSNSSYLKSCKSNKLRGNYWACCMIRLFNTEQHYLRLLNVILYVYGVQL